MSCVTRTFGVACEARVHVAAADTITKRVRSQRARKSGRAFDQCPGRAAYLVDGKPLCLNHAGQAALKILMAGAETPPAVKPGAS